ncbi:MAG TPA: hypothetical protein PLF84_15280 [Bryobacteraceae bacterium]|nr:hypothetical protein [Bryobacteraceae bacterium]
MSEKLREYWAEVRELERVLPDPVYLVAGESPRVSLASPSAAARVLADGRARRATVEEIKAYQSGEDRRALVAEALQQNTFEGVLIVPPGKVGPSEAD